MTKIVPDSNVIISSVFWRGNPYEVIRRGVLGRYQMITSAAILDEVVDKLRNKFKFPEENIRELMDTLLTYCHVVEPSTRFDIVRDKKDNKIVECAFEGKPDFIVTGDPDLLVLKDFRGIKIVTPSSFLDLMDRD